MANPLTHQPKIFLSYGVRDAAEIAERLHRDLSARGYHVWQDIHGIRVGWPWDEELRDGLRNADVLIALLSPQSVRRRAQSDDLSRTDSVCLDEIAFARDPARIPIVPVKVLPCEAPFLVNRLQQIDLQRWRESDAAYQAGVDRICETISAALAGEQHEATWAWLPRPWDFEPLLRKYRQDFVGRQWVFAEIDHWLAEGRQSALLIIGDPGIGKSAIVASLVQQNPGGQVLAYHCCSADTPVTLEPAAFVRNLAATIAGRSDDYAAMLQDAALVQALQDADDDPASAFEAAILSPLHKLQPPNRRRYLLVDALDEALTHSRRPTIVDLLTSRIARLPHWLGIVATTRGERNVMDRLTGLAGRKLDAQEPRNQDDVQSFIAARLAQEPLHTAALADGRPFDALVKGLLGASQGNFLYAATALQAVSAGQFDFKTIERLPPGLVGIFRAFFDRIFARSEDTFEGARTVLEVVLGAREPLTRGQIAGATALGAPRQLNAILGGLDAFLPAREGRYAVFHKALADWLTGWDESGDRPTAGRYTIDLDTGRQRVADWCWGLYRDGAAHNEGYCLRHLAHHLAECGRADAMRLLLLDFSWLQAKLAHLGVSELIKDFRRVRDDLSLRSLGEAIQLAAHILAEDPQQLDVQLTGRLADSPDPTIRDLIARIARREGHCWLRPLSRSFAGPGQALRATLVGHGPRVRAAALSHDGKVGVSGADDAQVKVWDLDSGRLLWSLAGHEDNVLCVAVCAAGRRAASGSTDGSVRVWDLAEGRLLHVLTGHRGRVRALAISSDGQRVVSDCDDGTLRIWDADRGVELTSIPTHEDWARSVSLLEGSTQLATVWNDFTIHVVDLQTGTHRKVLSGHTAFVNAIAHSNRTGLLASGSDDGYLRLWDLGREGVGELVPAGHGRVHAVAIDEAGTRVLSSGDDGVIRVWTTRPLRLAGELAGHTANVGSLALTPDGRRALTASSDGSVKVWDLESPASGGGLLTLLNRASGAQDRPRSLAVGPTSSQVLVGRDRGMLELHNVGEGLACEPLVVGEMQLMGRNAIVAVAWRDERTAVAADSDGNVSVVDVDRWNVIHETSGQRGSVNAFSFSGKGQRAIIGRMDGTVEVREADGATACVFLSAHTTPVFDVALDRDGKIAMSVGTEGVLKVWDVGARLCVCTVGAEDDDFLRNMVLAPDGSNAAIRTNYQFELQTWASFSPHDLQHLGDHRFAIESLSFSACGRYLASGAWDKTLKVWDLSRRRLLAQFHAESGITACAFAPDSRTLVVGEVSGNIHYLRLEAAPA